MSELPQENPDLEKIRSLDPDLLPFFEERDAASRLIATLPTRFSPREVVQATGNQVWESAGLFFLNLGRIHEALGIFWKLYHQMLLAQVDLNRVHKGMPLVWMSDCYRRLGFPVHAKRYLMLTLCEDALRENGVISPNDTGVYFRLVWGMGLPDEELRRYARRFYELAQELPEEALFPEAILQRLDDNWLAELPSPSEASSFRINPIYVQHLLGQLGTGSGEALELLSEYLMSCMPGCRTRRRIRSQSTDYDIICAMEGFDADFRSEMGRYFVCECKDWSSAADFTVMAKFCRVLDSIKSRFGVLFSRSGISGSGDTRYAERERLKVYQDRGIVIVVLNLSDLQEISSGANLITILRQKYEAVRLDLRTNNPSI